jgi:hypothetical protein
MDMRILTTFPNHRKTRRLIKVLGYEAFYSLVCLWAYVADNHPKGNLNGYDEIEIEESAKWTGKSGEFIKAILDEKTCFLLKTDNGYALRNWSKHQGWLINAPERRNKAKAAAEARWVGKKENKPDATSNAPSIPTSNAIGNAKNKVEQCPSPSPSPSPNPLILLSPSANSSVEEIKDAPVKKKKKILLTYSDDFEKFWRECPNKKDKGEASKIFSDFVEAGVSVEVLIDAMSKYAKSVAGRELKHIKHPSTWLNKQCWNDTYDAITQSDSNTGIAQSQLEELQRRFGH